MAVPAESSSRKPLLSIEQLTIAFRGKPVLLKYGAFIQTIFEFLIIALVLFIVIKGINKLKRPPPPAVVAPPGPTKTEELLQQIRDELAKR